MKLRPPGDAQKQRHRPMALLLAVLLPAMGSLPSAQAAPAIHAIDIEAVQFSPATLEVKTGDTVIWKNKDAFPHNVTSEPGGLRSGDIGSGHSWRFKTDKSGVFPYVCTLHPGMKAVLVVK
jgi:plastocyanin